MGYACFKQSTTTIVANGTASGNTSNINVLQKFEQKLHSLFKNLIGSKMNSVDEMKKTINKVTNVVINVFKIDLQNSWKNNTHIFSKLDEIKHSQEEKQDLNNNDEMTIVWFLHCFVDIKSTKISRQSYRLSCQLSSLSLKLLSLSNMALNKFDNDLNDPQQMENMTEYLQKSKVQEPKETALTIAWADL